MPTIELENVSKSYKLKKKHIFARQQVEIGVREVNLTIEQGEFVFVVGSSGAGKSTLLNLISGRTRPDTGKVLLNGENLSRMMLLKRNRPALSFGLVTQEQSLIRKMTIKENLMLAARVGMQHTKFKQPLEQRVEKVLGLVGVPGVEARYPIELSIGECRRVELARALINSPPILVLDEITANLDDDNIWDIFHLLTEMNRRGTTIVMATHAGRYVNIMRRRVITLVDGRIFGDVEKGRYGDLTVNRRPSMSDARVADFANVKRSY